MNKSHLEKGKLSHNCEIINIEEVLTQKTCANIVVEIIKLLSHQKLQIPYKYEVLKYLVEEKKASEVNGEKQCSWQSQKHFHTASTAVNTLDSIFKNIISEMECPDHPEEVFIVLGATPTLPKEVFKIIIPGNLGQHYNENHSHTSKNTILSTMRKITTSTHLSKTIFNPLQPTNMYIIFSRRKRKDNRIFSEFFHPIANYRISPKVSQTIINLLYSESVSFNSNCCNQMVVFNDFSTKCNLQSNGIDGNGHDESNSRSPGMITCEDCHTKTDSEDILNCCPSMDSEERNWFQSSLVLKGFKDCFVNGVSVSNSWLKS